MKRYLTQKQSFILGLLLIALIYSAYNICFDLTYVPDISGKLKHVNKLLWLLLVYAAGTWILKNNMSPWMTQLWHLIYLVCLTALILIGVYDWHTGFISPSLRNFANTVHELLLSPVLFGSIGLLQWRLAKEVENKPFTCNNQ